MDVKRSQRKVSGHGSISKAGKVRMQTPKIAKTKTSKRKCPRIRNRRAYEKRFELNRKSGQNWME